MGSAEGLSPFAGSLRVSLRYNFFPSLARKGTRFLGRYSRLWSAEWTIEDRQPIAPDLS